MFIGILDGQAHRAPATALDQHIPKLRAWKADPQSEEYDWESIEQTTAEMRQVIYVPLEDQTTDED